VPCRSTSTCSTST